LRAGLVNLVTILLGLIIELSSNDQLFFFSSSQRKIKYRARSDFALYWTDRPTKLLS